MPAARRSMTSTRRPRGCAAATFAALAATLAAAPVEAGRLHVIADGLPCPAAARLARQIERRTAAAVAEDAELALVMNVEEPDRLRLKLLGSGKQAEKSLHFSRSDCPELPNTVVLLVRSWLTSAWDAPAAPPPAPLAPEPPRMPVAADPAPPAARPAPGPQARFRAAALGGLFTAAGPQGARAALVLDGRYALSPRWGVGLVATYHAPGRAEIETGSLSASLWAAGFTAHWRQSIDDRTRVELNAGALMTSIVVRSENYARVATSHLYDAGLLASARVAMRIAGPFEWIAEAEFLERLREEALLVVGAARTFTVPRGHFGLLTGFSVDAF